MARSITKVFRLPLSRLILGCARYRARPDGLCKTALNNTYSRKNKGVMPTVTTVGLSITIFGYKIGMSNDNETDPLTELYRSARLAHMRQDLKKADDLYHEGLKMASELVANKEITSDKFVTARTLIYDGLADIAMATGQVEHAEALYKETMKGCLQQGMDQNANAIVEIALKLASIYAMQGKKEEAEEGYKFCMEATLPKMMEKEKEWNAAAKAGKRVTKVEKSVVTGDISQEEQEKREKEELEKDTAALLGMTLGSYGRFLLYEKRYSEALPMFEKARLYAENTLGMASNQYIVVLNDLATLYIVTKNLNQAEKLLKEGIDVSEKNKLGEGAMLYCNLGAVYLRKGEIEPAMRNCTLGLEVAQKFDHKMANKMAEACLRKGASVIRQKTETTKT